MAISTYTNLQTALGNWLARADLTSELPDFIQLAEAKFNRTLRTLQMEARTPLNITGEFVAVPNDFLEVRSLRLDQTPAIAMDFMTGDQGVRAYGGSGTPRFFSVSGGFFRFAPVPDTGSSATLIYYAKIPPLATNATNWLLLSHPDLYLYGAIMEASGRIQNDERIPGIAQMYGQVLSDVKGSDARSKWGGNSMAMRAA